MVQGIHCRKWIRCRSTILIVLNLDHYRLDADFKHGLHYHRAAYGVGGWV